MPGGFLQRTPPPKSLRPTPFNDNGRLGPTSYGRTKQPGVSLDVEEAQRRLQRLGLNEGQAQQPLTPMRAPGNC